MTFGSLFAGCGGFDLGLERAGMECRWQVEIDPWCRRVLEKHWPGVRRHDDVRTFSPEPTEDWTVDLICGGFPCQDISQAGKRAGITGARSGLWSEFHRIVCVLRPRFVLVENVPGLLVRGLDRVLGDLAEIGYDAEWDCIPAFPFGIPQKRDRLFLVAYPHGQRCQTGPRIFRGHAGGGILEEEWEMGWLSRPKRGHSGRVWRVPDGTLHGMAHGVPAELERLRVLGNAVVPQVAEWIGRALLESGVAG